MRFFALAIAFGLALALTASPAGAQAAPDPSPPAETRPSPQRSLDELFERLSKAEDEREGTGIAALIQRRWSRSGSDTADLLMARARQAVEAKDLALAVELLDRAIALEPNWAEAWYRRANLFYLLDDPIVAMADLRRVLAIEPRHFGAWTGLGHILHASDDHARALEAYRRALRIHPQQSDVKTLVERLTLQVDGLDL